MTITVLPMDATAGAPTYTAQHARQAQAALYGNPTGRVFGTRSGWRVGTLPSIVSVTSSAWTLNPCSCMIEPAAALYQGAYGWASDQVITGSMTAADSTNPRIDILYIQVNDSSAGDGSGLLTAPVSYLAGAAAPSGTQVAPSLPPRSFLVATIAVPKSGSGSPTVTLNNAYFTASGGILPVFSQADQDGLTASQGQVISREDLSSKPLFKWNGTAWSQISGLAHAEFITQTPVTTIVNGGISVGNLVADAANSFNGGFASGSAGGQITINATGVYLFSFILLPASNPSNTNLFIQTGGATVAATVGGWYGSQQTTLTATFYAVAGTTFTFNCTTTNSVSTGSRIRVTKLQGS